MPGKHVRFAPAASPSSPFSDTSSLPSSDGPFTPPPLRYEDSPYATSPLPKIPSTIHPVLAVSTIPALIFDVTFPVDAIVPSNPSLSPAVFSQPATSPPLPSLTILHSRLPWPIRVLPASGSLYACVTVGDVVATIYSKLRTRASGSEFDSIPTHERKQKANDAYHRRYKRMSNPAFSAEEAKSGLRRVDFLGELTTFVGLSSTSLGPEVWELRVS